MRVLISGACGFVGSTLARAIREQISDVVVTGIDNLWRPGSETNRDRLRAAGIRVVHGDIRCASDVEALPAVDWVIDAAANASVLAGVDGATTPRQIVEHNLVGTVNLLEFCRRQAAGCILLSSSRVYSVAPLRAIPLAVNADAFAMRAGAHATGLSPSGITEEFPAGAPASLYGTTKLASEQLILEYADAFGFPVWINRCGVLAGAGQFGQPAQGIFTWWIHRWRQRWPLTYLGYEGHGFQVRDCLHPLDLATLIVRQMQDPASGDIQRLFNVSGGLTNAMSLAQLSAWCRARFGAHDVASDPRCRAYDVPWVVLDAARAQRRWHWSPSRSIDHVLEEIAGHADTHPDWLTVSEG